MAAESAGASSNSRLSGTDALRLKGRAYALSQTPLSARLTQCARLRREACHIQFGTLLAAVGPQMTSYDRCQPRQCEEASQKDILLIRRTSRIGPAERHC